MPEPANPGTDPMEPVEPVRVPDHDLDDLSATLSQLVADSRTHTQLLDRLAEPTPTNGDGSPPEGPASAFILAMDGTDYTDELTALTAWVDHLLLPVYGREITASRPWCQQWHEHPEAVARLHALWLAWQQLTDAEAGPAGPATWHRDHLDHTWLQLRAPDGPFAACTTNPNRPHHRLLATPGPAPTGDGA